MAFKLPDLPYAYNALEPYIDEATMIVHHTAHHQGYTNGLNAAIEGTELDNQSIEQILSNLDPSKAAVRNNGGGYFNHNLYWTLMSPNGGGQPEGDLLKQIVDTFGSFDSFKESFSKAGLTRFGSGWAWLTLDNGELKIGSTPNQDNPLMPFSDVNGVPVLGMDVWEHAYYLKHQNKRAAYINDFFEVINWEEVSKLYNANK
ncbi:MAG: superoxide dismutase [Saprospiraceae bacterium]